MRCCSNTHKLNNNHLSFSLVRKRRSDKKKYNQLKEKKKITNILHPYSADYQKAYTKSVNRITSKINTSTSELWKVFARRTNTYTQTRTENNINWIQMADCKAIEPFHGNWATETSNTNICKYIVREIVEKNKKNKYTFRIVYENWVNKENDANSHTQTHKHTTSNINTANPNEILCEGKQPKNKKRKHLFKGMQYWHLYGWSKGNLSRVSETTFSVLFHSVSFYSV